MQATMGPRHRYLSCIAAIVSIFVKYKRTHAFVPPLLSLSPECPATLADRLPSHLHRTSTHNVVHPIFARHCAPLLASSSVQPPPNDPRVEPRTTHKVTVNLPLGLVLEDMDSDPSYGVAIIGINEGNAAKYNAKVFSNIKSHANSIDCRNDCICVRDKIMSVNGTPCHDKCFDDVIDLISSTDSNSVTLELGRIQDSTVLNYYSGICISAKPGESYGFLAEKLGIDISYECRTGNCLTCARWMEFPDKERDLVSNEGRGNLYKRTILNCVGKLPRGYQWLHVLDYTLEISEGASQN